MSSLPEDPSTPIAETNRAREDAPEATDARAEAAAVAAEDSTDADAHDTSDEEADAIGQDIIRALKSCYDPEIPVDIYELGLIYAVELEGRHAVVRMTLTSPMCPVAESLPLEVEGKVREVSGVESAEIDLVWDPPWSPDMMSEAARLELGF